jgi:predicted esterase
MSRTPLRALVVAMVVLILVTAVAVGRAQPDSPSGTGAPGKAQSDYAARLAGLSGSDWRQAFALGQEIADLPPEQGWEIMRSNWGKIEKVEARQQMLKAWFYGTGMPLKPRSHIHLRDVLELGKQDPSPQVQEWADNFLKKSEGGVPAAKNAGGKTDEVADIADAPFQDLRAGADENKRFFLIGPRAGAAKPATGYRLVLVLPGGDGSAEFRPFVQRMFKNALSEDTVIAELVAPKWSDSKDRIVWPTKGLKDESMKFSTEEFVQAVIDEVKGRMSIDDKRIDALGWSSGGPPVYAVSLAERSPLRGAFVAMSVFKPETLPALAGASGDRYYILHSPKDFIQMRFPKAAEEKLREAGATTTLVTYEGGHGWHGDVFGMLRAGFEWLDKTDK